MSLTVWQTAALTLLEFAVRRDEAKGGDGIRTTRDVADYIRITTRQARDVIYSLADLGFVEVFEGTPLECCITQKGVAAIARAEDAHV